MSWIQDAFPVIIAKMLILTVFIYCSFILGDLAFCRAVGFLTENVGKLKPVKWLDARLKDIGQ